ncbi:sulfotransferase 1B1-like isoform X1 [Malaclemys terrapin pileata]|uniref:sulfotransferase 1B1-like n=1 Tax=Malaclemys terrapin pileata TaxID=2991368 RepID=UPI0023A80875|nr:sulfotransferase 1B1-like [Malaclemys terrapin pileata]XP_053882783.1 sulfotransferase 1B1-like isoform X1 [Malaclemys terrapin pileata]
MAAPENYTKALQESQDVFHRFPLQLVHGIPLMEPIAQQWGPIENFQARPDDLLISTYPKAGTTWMQEIVDLILVQGDVEKACRAPTHIRIPFLEICSPPPVPSGVQQLANVPSPRVIKTHLPFQLVPKSFWENRCKVIYVARNAKDNVVSYYFFDQMNKTQPEPGPWELYVQKFMDGKLAWGSWYDHVCRYWAERANHCILYVFYEDMKEDPAREIRRVMDFLEVELPPQVLEKIVQQTSFQIMKENPMANYSSVPSTILDQTVSPFMRKGQVGDWKNHFTVAQSKVFDAHYQRRMQGTGLHFRTQL